MTCRRTVLATLGVAIALATAVPAHADWDGGWHGPHRHHWHGPWGYAPPPPVYYAPPRVYYAPPPVYYAPPRPPPVYYYRYGY